MTSERKTYTPAEDNRLIYLAKTYADKWGKKAKNDPVLKDRNLGSMKSRLRRLRAHGRLDVWY